MIETIVTNTGMGGVSNVKLFLITSLAVNAIPGVDRIIVLTTSIRSGSRSGIMTSMGVSLATFVHAVMVSTGLYLIVEENDALLDAIQKVGIVFLLGMAIYILVKSFRNRIVVPSVFDVRGSFVEGFSIHFFNPLAIVFIISYIPQFIIRDRNFTVTFIALSTISNVIGITMNVATAIAFSKLQRMLQNQWLERGASLLGATVILCFAGSKLIDLYG